MERVKEVMRGSPAKRGREEMQRPKRWVQVRDEGDEEKEVERKEEETRWRREKSEKQGGGRRR